MNPKDSNVYRKSNKMAHMRRSRTRIGTSFFYKYAIPSGWASQPEYKNIISCLFLMTK